MNTTVSPFTPAEAKRIDAWKRRYEAEALLCNRGFSVAEAHRLHFLRWCVQRRAEAAALLARRVLGVA